MSAREAASQDSKRSTDGERARIMHTVRAAIEAVMADGEES